MLCAPVSSSHANHKCFIFSHLNKLVQFFILVKLACMRPLIDKSYLQADAIDRSLANSDKAIDVSYRQQSAVNLCTVGSCETM